MAKATTADAVRFIDKAKQQLLARGLTSGTVVVTVNDEGAFIDVYPAESVIGEAVEAVEFEAEFDINPQPEIDAFDPE